MSGGAVKKSSMKKTSKKSSKKKSSKKMSGGINKKSSKKSSKNVGGEKKVNPGFQAFLDLKKKIAIKLNVSNSPKVGKVAGIVQKEIKEKNPNMEAIQISKKAYELFESNIEMYRKML